MEERRTGVCMICERQHTGGIRIMSAFLCDDCSAEIVRTDVRDKRYSFFVKQMKQVLPIKNTSGMM